MTSLQHHAVSSVTSDSCSCTPPPSGSVPSSTGETLGWGASTTTPHSTNRREATWVAARRALAGSAVCGREQRGSFVQASSALHSSRRPDFSGGGVRPCLPNTHTLQTGGERAAAHL